MQILFGTKNPAKLFHMKNCLKDIPISIIGLNDLNKIIPDVEEVGNSPLENAKIKARAYYKEFNMPVFSCDTGLFIEGIGKERQPGVNVRTLNGKRLDDNEMIEYYSSLSREFNGKMYARYENAIYMIINNDEYYYNGEDIKSERFIISHIPHKKIIDGFPIDSLSINISSNKYYYDIEYEEDYFNVDKGFNNFIKKILKNISII